MAGFKVGDRQNHPALVDKRDDAELESLPQFRAYYDDV
jgi:hypothetical protein